MIQHYDTSNMTGCHRGPKWKLRAGYRALALKWTSCYKHRHYNVAISFHRRVWYCALSLHYCMYSKFRHCPHPHRLPLCQIFKFCLCRSLHCWASPWRKITYSITQSSSLTHPAYLMPEEPKLSLWNNPLNACETQMCRLSKQQFLIVNKASLILDKILVCVLIKYWAVEKTQHEKTDND